MQSKENALLRNELTRLLSPGGAHAGLDKAVAKIPKKYYAAPVRGSSLYLMGDFRAYEASAARYFRLHDQSRLCRTGLARRLLAERSSSPQRGFLEKLHQALSSRFARTDRISE